MLVRGVQNLLARNPDAENRWSSVSVTLRTYWPFSCRLSECVVGEIVTWNSSVRRGEMM